MYYNPILKIMQTAKETPYLKPGFVSWGEYAKTLAKTPLDKTI